MIRHLNAIFKTSLHKYVHLAILQASEHSTSDLSYLHTKLIKRGLR